MYFKHKDIIKKIKDTEIENLNETKIRFMVLTGVHNYINTISYM